MNGGYVPDHDELPVAKLRSSGVILLGKTNVPEFAMRGFTGDAVYVVTCNPWNLSLAHWFKRRRGRPQLPEDLHRWRWQQIAAAPFAAQPPTQIWSD